MKLNKEVSQRMNMLRFLMIFGVVVLHTPPYLPLGGLPITFFDYFKAFFQGAVFRTTVPILTFISAYLVFASGLDRTPLKLYKKKFDSLVVPFMFFNFSLVIVTWIAQRYFNIHIFRELLDIEIMEWMDAVFGLRDSPVNYPLHFLRNLVVLVLVAPLLGKLLRSAPYVGLVVVFCIAHFNLDGMILLRDNMLIMFYLGGMAALLGVNMLALDKYRVPALVIFCIACMAVVVLRVKDLNYLVYASPFLVWPAASLLTNTRVGIWMTRMSSYSFFIFLAHAPVLAAAWFVYKPYQTVIPTPLFWFVTPVLVVAFLVLVWNLCNATFGSAFAFATGCYKKKKLARPLDNTAMDGMPAPHLK